MATATATRRLAAILAIAVAGYSRLNHLTGVGIASATVASKRRA